MPSLFYERVCPMTTPNKHLSFEFFPPQTPEKDEALTKVATTLATYSPDCFTVTFGAGGSTRTKTIDTVNNVKRQTGCNTAAHISCIGATKDSMATYLKTLQQEHQLNQLVALRGDIPSGMQDYGEFRYASELVSFIRQTTGDHFKIAVAAYPEYHPQCQCPATDFSHFKFKVDQGADLAYTQYFYSSDAYFHFLDNCQSHNIDIPIIPGIMPITNFKQLARFSDTCGAEIPRFIRKRLEAYQDDDHDSLIQFGIDVVSELCQSLLQHGAPGIHFYSMNRAFPLEAILKNLNFTPNAHD